MWILVLMVLLLVVTPAFAEQTFSEQYERDYNTFNPPKARKEAKKGVSNCLEL